MTDFTAEDLNRAERKGFALGFYSCWTYFNGQYGIVRNKDNEVKLKKIENLQSALFSASLELLDLNGTYCAYSIANDWLKHYEKNDGAAQEALAYTPSIKNIEAENDKVRSDL